MGKNVKNEYEFKAEVKQLLNILVHSLYTNKEIFLRELISNASDAIDKLRFESNRGTEIKDKELEYEIRLDFDKEKKLLTISDTGIGLNEEEIIKNIGTIAKSGSADFIKMLSENKESANNIIGKFGVGFYSVFMVASKVVISSRSFKTDAKPIRWESDGLGSYVLTELEEDLTRGTKIEIHLKDDALEFADKHKLEQIVKGHSNFISFPIYIEKERVNTISAIWREPKTSIKPEQYNEFYKFLTYDSEDPFGHIHASVDAPIQFNSLMFIPKKNIDYLGFNRDDYGLDLYVRRVLIQHQNKDLLPEYLSFIKGVVDSEDLPLNISRESLQENIIFTKISQSVTNQIFSFLTKLSNNDPEKFKEFWKEHGRIFKLGYNDFTNREKYSELLRFNYSSAKTNTDIISFAEYTAKLKHDQKEIYYIFGQSREALESDPHMEIFKSKGLEVLFLFDPVDEFVMSGLMRYKDYEFKSIDQVDLNTLDKFESTDEQDKEVQSLSKDDSKQMSSLLSAIKKILGDKVTDVKESKRLKDSPACLVNSDNTMSSSMQKMMQLMNKDASIPKKILEVNVDHVLLRNLLKIYKNNSDDKYISTIVEQLFEGLLLMEGYLPDPHKMIGRMTQLLSDSSDWYTGVKKIS